MSKNKNTIKSWLEFVDQSLSNLKQYENVDDGDITELIPSVSKLDKFDIQILNTPYLINPRGEDLLKRKVIEIEDLESELENINHIYSIRLEDVLSSSFNIEYKLVLRAVWK